MDCNNWANGRLSRTPVIAGTSWLTTLFIAHVLFALPNYIVEILRKVCLNKLEDILQIWNNYAIYSGLIKNAANL